MTYLDKADLHEAKFSVSIALEDKFQGRLSVKQIKRAAQQGFTLIELVVVIVILGILAAIAVPQFTDLSASARAAVRDGACGALQSSAVLLYASNKASSGFGAVTSNVTLSSNLAITGSCAAPIVTYSGDATTTTCTALPATLCSGS